MWDRDGPARAVGQEGHGGGRADRAAVGKREFVGPVGIEPNPQRAFREAAFGGDAPGDGDHFAGLPQPNSAHTGERDDEPDVPESQ